MPDPTLIDILGRGYFPKELPPTFTTQSFGRIAAANTAQLGAASDNCQFGSLSRYYLARPGTLRRALSIPNPIFQFRLAENIASSWTEIANHCENSGLSISKPVEGGADERAIKPATSRRELLDRRLEYRASHRFMLRADISQFYPTVYTHSVPWALHTREVAKAHRRDRTLLGNRLDSCLQGCQDSQTKGIPIGPDSSLVIAEILLTASDVELLNKFPRLKGFRYYDDYELYFDSRAEAEAVQPELERTLSSYELTLNPTKCAVETVLQPIDFPWARIRRVEIRSDVDRQRNDLVFLFEEAFELARQRPTDHVLKYTIGRMENVSVREDNLDLYTKLLCQAVMIEHGVLPLVINQMLWYRQEDAVVFDDVVDQELLNVVLNGQVVAHASLGNSSEVAWAIWGAIAMRKRLGDAATTAASKLEDSLVALLTLSARDVGVLTNAAVDETWWRTQLTYDALLGEHWPLAYEAVVQGWLPRTPARRLDRRLQAAKDCFDFLAAASVRFFTPAFGHDPNLKHNESYGDAAADEEDADDTDDDDAANDEVDF